MKFKVNKDEVPGLLKALDILKGKGKKFRISGKVVVAKKGGKEK